MARAGASQIILVGTSSTEAAALSARIRSTSAITQAHILPNPIQHDNIISVRDAADHIRTLTDKIHIIINIPDHIYPTVNAVNPENNRENWTLAVNHLSHFLLTRFLLHNFGLISEDASSVDAAAQGETLRIVNVTCESWKPLRTYGRSKTATILFTLDAVERHRNKGVLICTVNPGVINTRHLQTGSVTVNNNIPGDLSIQKLKKMIEKFGRADMVKRMIKHAIYDRSHRVANKSVTEGVASILFAAFEPTLATSNGAYITDCHIHDTIAADYSDRPTQFWDLTIKILRTQLPTERHRL